MPKGENAAKKGSGQVGFQPMAKGVKVPTAMSNVPKPPQLGHTPKPEKQPEGPALSASLASLRMSQRGDHTTWNQRERQFVGQLEDWAANGKLDDWDTTRWDNHPDSPRRLTVTYSLADNEQAEFTPDMVVSFTDRRCAFLGIVGAFDETDGVEYETRPISVLSENVPGQIIVVGTVFTDDEAGEWMFRDEATGTVRPLSDVF